MSQQHSDAGIFVGAEAFVDFGHKLDRMQSHLDRISMKPVYKPVGNSIVVPAVIPALLTLVIPESPARGRVWNILKIVLASGAPPDVHTTTTATADVYAGTNPDISGPTIDNAILGAAPIPSVNNITKHVDWCSTGENVFAVINNATAGQSLILIARVAEYPVEAVEAISILWT